MSGKKKKCSKKDLQLVADEKKVVKADDLYRALHWVGDDPVKADIESILEELLPDDAMRTVRAVFNLATGWKGEI